MRNLEFKSNGSITLVRIAHISTVQFNPDKETIKILMLGGQEHRGTLSKESFDELNEEMKK